MEKKVDNGLFFAMAEEGLREGRKVKLLLVGSSMEPTLRDGDKLTLAPATGPLKVGDVALFRCGGKHLLHRIVAIDRERLVMQGDNCYTSETAKEEDVVGVLCAVERGGVAVDVASEEWKRRSRGALGRKKVRNFVIRWFGSKGRRRLRPWYFVALAILMWAPLNGVGIRLNTYVFGLRLDHLLHAMVYVPCFLFVMDLPRWKGWQKWLLALAIGLFTEGVQYLLPYRGFDVNDLVANVIGITLGAVIVSFVRQEVRRRHRYPDPGKHEGCR